MEKVQKQRRLEFDDITKCNNPLELETFKHLVGRIC